MELENSRQGSPNILSAAIESNPKWKLHLTSHWNVSAQIKRVETKLMDKNLPISEEVRHTLLNTVQAMFTDDLDACILVLNSIEDTLYALEKQPGLYQMDSLLDVLQTKFDYRDSMKEKMRQISEGLKAIPEYQELTSFDFACDESHAETVFHPAQDEEFLSQDFRQLNEKIVLVALENSINELKLLQDALLDMKREMDNAVQKTVESICKNREQILIIKAFFESKLSS
jgi:hypothetical protein